MINRPHFDYTEVPETRAVLSNLDFQASKLFIGIPKESDISENRIPLTPSSVASLTTLGHRVIIESGAGTKANFTDLEFSEAGAEITLEKEKIFAANIILKAAPPSLFEVELMKTNQLLISPLHILAISKEYIELLRKKKVTAIALEWLRDEDGTFPMVRIMSELAGISAIQVAAQFLNQTNGGIGVLLGGISGVPPAKVVILGAGVVAEFATRTALGLGASVRIFDNNIYKLMRIQARIGRQLHTSALNQIYLKKELKEADVVIGAIHSKTGRTPIVVTEDMVEQMKTGSIIVDVSIDQGGCFETSEMMRLEKPSFVKHGVIHYCVPNMASNYARTSSEAMSNILTPLLFKISTSGNLYSLLYAQTGIRNGIYTYKGALTNFYLSERLGMKYTDIELLITSSI